MSDIKNYNKFIDEIIKEVEDELEESTTTGNVDGYQTPYAFGDDSEKNKTRKKQVATQAGYSVVDNDVKNIDEVTDIRTINMLFKNKTIKDYIRKEKVDSIRKVIEDEGISTKKVSDDEILKIAKELSESINESNIKVRDKVEYKGNTYLVTKIDDSREGGFVDTKWHLNPLKTGLKKVVLDTIKDVKKINESVVNKQRATAELKQKLSGKRSDGMGKYTGKVYGLDDNGKRVELKSLSDINKYSKFELSESKDRDYAAEYQARKKDYYKKYQSSDKAKKYRAELNQYNREKGTYGNGDGLDASHKGGKISGFETENKNRSRKEKSRLKKENVKESSNEEMVKIQNWVNFQKKRKYFDKDIIWQWDGKQLKIETPGDPENPIIFSKKDLISAKVFESISVNEIADFFDSKAKKIEIGNTYMFTMGRAKTILKIKDIDPVKGIRIYDFKDREYRVIPISTWNAKKYGHYMTRVHQVSESLNEATSLLDMFKYLQSFQSAGVTPDDITQVSKTKNKKITVNNNSKLRDLWRDWGRGEYDEDPELLVQRLRRFINESIDSISDAKKTLSNVYKIVSVENVTNQRKGPKNYIKVQYIPKTSPQTQNVEFHKIFYTDTNEGDEILKTLKLKLTESKEPKRRNRWLELKNDESMHGHKKLAVGLKELKYQLAEVEKFLGWYNKLKNINELDSDNYWKRTNNNIYKIKERLINIVKKIQEIEK